MPLFDTGTHPDWLRERLAESDAAMPDVEARMQLVIDLARENVRRKSGGPFAAAVFDMHTHELIAAGVNRVEPLNCSIAHAEMMALAAAEKKLGSFDLGADGLPACELVTSSEPCAMCFGALSWSGIRKLVCGTRVEDVEGIGFDEGPKHPDWVAELERRGIEVMRDICRDKAVQVLNAYHTDIGMIYNGLRGQEE